MRLLAICLALFAAVALSGCAKTRTVRYDGPEVTRVVVMKSARKLFLMHHDRPLATYDVGLGFQPVGHKEREGDGRTPVGRYMIDKRNHNSNFHLSIGVSYPNAQDVAVARAMGVDPGGDIFIHGWNDKSYRQRGRDWTFGCIAVRDAEMEQIYTMVATGTPIDIYE